MKAKMVKQIAPLPLVNSTQLAHPKRVDLPIELHPVVLVDAHLNI
jgi:hypothetical protein